MELASYVNKEGSTGGEPTMITTLSKKFQAFLRELRQSAGAQIIKEEIQLFKVTNKRPENLEKIYHALFTITLTSVEPEQAFSAMGLFAIKIRSRLNDDTFNAIIFMHQS